MFQFVQNHYGKQFDLKIGLFIRHYLLYEQTHMRKNCLAQSCAFLKSINKDQFEV
jgi:hypothetical protein